MDNLFLAPNTLTQRMSAPKCSGMVAMDVSKMKDGDVAGFTAFNGLSGVLAVVKENGKKHLVMSVQSVRKILFIFALTVTLQTKKMRLLSIIAMTMKSGSR